MKFESIPLKKKQDSLKTFFLQNTRVQNNVWKDEIWKYPFEEKTRLFKNFFLTKYLSPK